MSREEYTLKEEGNKTVKCIEKKIQKREDGNMKCKCLEQKIH